MIAYGAGAPYSSAMDGARPIFAVEDVFGAEVRSNSTPHLQAWVPRPLGGLQMAFSSCFLSFFDGFSFVFLSFFL